MAFLSVVLLPATMAQAPVPAPWVFAEDYNNWTFTSTAPNTYVSNSWNCWNTPLERGVPGYFVFGNYNTSTYYPVLIRDANPLLSEVVTPSSVSTAQSGCGFSAATTNQHYSFTVSSGTAGLQDAVASLSMGQNNSTVFTPEVVFVDRYWYGLIAGLPGNKVPFTVIASTVGSVGVNIIDTTTVPWTEWVWNGTNYVPSGATASFPIYRVSSYTNIAAPTALTTVAATCATNGGGCINTATTGGTIPASGAYRLGATCVDASGGETTQSIDTAAGAVVTVGATATNNITVTSPAGCTAANGAVGWRLYMSAASGASLSEILYSPVCSPTVSYVLQNTLVPATVCPIGSTATINSIITGTATIPSTNSAWPRVAGSSGSLPPYPALGTVAAAATGTLATINVPAGELNTLGRQTQVCGNGYATTNSTGGTLTLATTLASIPGVTTITPFTAVSGATAASAQADPFDFCVTYTTAVTGTSGKLEAHGWVLFSLAGTAPGTPAVDIVITTSATIDLTKQTQLAITITPTTTALTAAQIRQLSISTQN